MSRSKFGVRLATAVLCAALPFAQTSAQSCQATGTISGDRPGTGTTPMVLGMGARQIETGWSMVHDASIVQHAVAETMIRIPVRCGIEVRFAIGGYEIDRPIAGEMTTGLMDGYVGTKVRLLEGQGLRPHFAILAGTSVPLGGGFSTRHVEPDALLSAQWDLPAQQALIVYNGYASRVENEVRGISRSTGVNLTSVLNARTATFVEFSESARNSVRAHDLTAGFQVFPQETLQFDVFVSTPMPHAGSQYSLGAGIARRF